MATIFLQAEWRKLVMANYAVDRKVLDPYLPFGTEIDLWNDTCFISLVGFMFQNTRLKGFKIPFHIHFEEVNLRFYVRYNDNGQWKRGVVFMKEIVPKPALTFVANAVYGENYETLPMRHIWTREHSSQRVEYLWKKRRKWHLVKVVAGTELLPIPEGSEAEFMTEHYWGYTKIADSKTSEYEVKHPRWLHYEIQSYQIDVHFDTVYGPEFAFLNAATPRSVFLAEGSEISVNAGRIL